MSSPAFYGDTWAPIYDDVHAHLEPTATVEVLAALAGHGTALELGSGTGRVAIPLAGRGVAVHGIEASQAMVDRMRAKPGGAAIPVTVGDFTTVPVEGEYALIYIVFSTLYGYDCASAGETGDVAATPEREPTSRSTRSRADVAGYFLNSLSNARRIAPDFFCVPA